MKRTLASLLVLLISAGSFATVAVAEEETTPAVSDTPAAMSDTAATEQPAADSATATDSDGTIM
ncbi:MAG TPA: hypothetical protein VN496_04370, partial [Burkholderiales bacterium]|nr:hypothetical protein [Burkholderiales bacterium]